MSAIRFARSPDLAGLRRFATSEPATAVQYNVSVLLREPTGSRREYLLDEPFAPTAEQRDQVRLEGRLTLLRTHRGVLATGTLQSEATSECARCLKQVSYPVELLIEEEFLPTVDPVTGASLPGPDEPGVFMIDAHHILDLRAASRQAWLLAEPMQTLCADSCRGLCPECGADRNGALCHCGNAPADSRWAALATLQRAMLNNFEEN